MYGIVTEDNGTMTYPVSYIDRRSITGQAIVNGRLVTEFRASEFHLAGTIVCDTPDTTYEGIESDTVTRLGQVFWDRGQYTPRGLGI